MNIEELSDIQSESGIIGTLIYHPEFILHSGYLQPGYFYETDNACIYWAIQDLYKNGITNIDSYNLSNKLQSNQGVQRVIERYNLPAVQEFIELYKETARHSVEEYKMLADNVVALAFKRDLVRSLNELTSSCFNPKNDLGKLSNIVYDKLDDLTSKYVVGEKIETLGEKIDDIWKEIVERRNKNGECGILSKFPAFNDYFTYENSELVVFQADSKQGKSTLLMNEAIHKLKNGVPTLVVDTEMSTRLYVERMLAHLTGISIKNIKNGSYSEEEAEKIKRNIDWIKYQPFVHIYEPDMPHETLYTICKQLKYKIGLQFVVYDYLKSNAVSASDNYNLLGQKCDFLKNNIAGKLNLSVATACQSNRAGEVADSKKIDSYASVVVKWGLKTQGMIAKDGLECGNAFAVVRKNRLGQQMLDDDEEEYLDFIVDGSKMTVAEATQHKERSEFR